MICRAAVGVGMLPATIDWTTFGLWAAATFTAVVLLGTAMNSRRKSLTDALRQHVEKTVPPRTPGEQNDAAAEKPAD